MNRDSQNGRSRSIKIDPETGNVNRVGPIFKPHGQLSSRSIFGQKNLPHQTEISSQTDKSDLEHQFFAQTGQRFSQFGSHLLVVDSEL